MHSKISSRVLIALTVAMGAPAMAKAQTAYQYNRAAQALQICASPAGAMVPECAQLRGAVGGSPTPSAASGLGGLLGGGGGKAGAAAGLLGLAAQAVAASRAPAAPTPAPGTNDYYTASAMATQNVAQAYQACVMRVGPSNMAGVQGCIAQMQAASTGGAPAAFAGGGFPGLAQPALPAGFPGAAQPALPAGFPQPGVTAAASLPPAAASAFSSVVGR